MKFSRRVNIDVNVNVIEFAAKDKQFDASCCRHRAVTI